MNGQKMLTRCGRPVEVLYPLKRTDEGKVLRVRVRRLDRCKHKERFAEYNVEDLRPAPQEA